MKVLHSLEKRRGVGRLCTACASGGINHVIVALLTFQALIRDGEGGKEG